MKVWEICMNTAQELKIGRKLLFLKFIVSLLIKT